MEWWFTQGLACLCCLVYACFFEWVAHRYFMHAPRHPFKDAFRGHMAHHQTFRGDHRFFPEEEGHAHGVTLRWYAFPLIILGHVPFFLGFEWLTGIPNLWGAIAGCSLYFAGYEYTHYFMHVPGHPVLERFAWFRFIREHHRIHHDEMRCNYNVFVPFADFCLGTLRTEGRKARG